MSCGGTLMTRALVAAVAALFTVISVPASAQQENATRCPGGNCRPDPSSAAGTAPPSPPSGLAATDLHLSAVRLFATAAASLRGDRRGPRARTRIWVAARRCRPAHLSGVWRSRLLLRMQELVWGGF